MDVTGVYSIEKFTKCLRAARDGEKEDQGGVLKGLLVFLSPLILPTITSRYDADRKRS